MISLIPNNLINKNFRNYSEAMYYRNLYNDFPNHAKALVKKNGNILYYKYIPGKEWYELIHKGYIDNIYRCRFLGKLLGKLHFKNCKITSGYENVCLNRNYISSNSIFYKSCMYEGRIHGDLHLKNIIINESGMFFIDRLRDRGDIMFDFPFIMSFRCFRFQTKNKKYLDYILNFFILYSRYIKGSKKDFFISFRNNFINYGIVCYNIAGQRSDFQERRYGKILSEYLTKESDFIGFIVKCYQGLI